MNNIEIYLNRLTDLFATTDKNQLSDNNFCEFPLKIENYHLYKILNFKKPFNMYYFALYKNKYNKIYFAKAWMGKNKNAGYTWLKNELFIQQVANQASLKVKSNFNIPAIATVYEDSNRLIIITDYVKHEHFYETKTNLVNVYNKAINYIFTLSESIDFKSLPRLMRLKPSFILFSLPLLYVKIILINPENIKKLTKLIFYIYQNAYTLFQGNWNSLVHRDLRGSILKKHNQYFIIDWQLAALSSPYLELAQMLFTYTESGKFPHFLLGLNKMIQLKKNPKKLIQLKCLAFYTIFVELALVKVKTINDINCYLDNIVNM
jgi:thiamine kinase-like enzyme